MRCSESRLRAAIGKPGTDDEIPTTMLSDSQVMIDDASDLRTLPRELVRKPSSQLGTSLKSTMTTDNVSVPVAQGTFGQALDLAAIPTGRAMNYNYNYVQKPICQGRRGALFFSSTSSIPYIAASRLRPSVSRILSADSRQLNFVWECK